MEHQSQEDGEKWSRQLNNPFPWQENDHGSDNESLALFKTML